MNCDIVAWKGAKELWESKKKEINCRVKHKKEMKVVSSNYESLILWIFLRIVLTFLFPNIYVVPNTHIKSAPKNI